MSANPTGSITIQTTKFGPSGMFDCRSDKVVTALSIETIEYILHRFWTVNVFATFIQYEETSLVKKKTGKR
jgi:hypothetical protein